MKLSLIERGTQGKIRCRTTILKGLKMDIKPTETIERLRKAMQNATNQIRRGEFATARSTLLVALDVAQNTTSVSEGAQSPVDVLVMLPSSLTAENGAKALLSGEFAEHERIECPECLKHGHAVCCETCGGNGYVTLDVPVSWKTIKAIYAKIVEHYSALGCETL